MRKVEAIGNDDCLYVLTTQTLDKDKGIIILNNSIKACLEAIQNEKGKLIVKEAPRAVSECEDTLLAEHMAKYNL
ncbi:hypothetical protein IEQ34_010974 [Dendrobium chrysotoxum]|uniref:Uncharacterized protein n=1 Tax=Dendrobium chrysotoxum TaxID=161865 RepID=A0AAV7GW98_DENCH|nr:hypothetical protein IEQ34_010974 [Dendrobium chrysotoxum]